MKRIIAFIVLLFCTSCATSLYTEDDQRYYDSGELCIYYYNYPYHYHGMPYGAYYYRITPPPPKPIKRHPPKRNPRRRHR